MHSAVIPARHRYPALPLAGQPGHERSLRPGPLVLRTTSLNTPTPTPDTDRTLSRRSEPSSCATLTGEQPDPWDLLQPQDVTSRHRGATQRRRCEVSGAISLFSPAFLLSVHRYCSFAELTEETAVKSLRHSCRSELTRQGISLP